MSYIDALLNRYHDPFLPIQYSLPFYPRVVECIIEHYSSGPPASSQNDLILMALQPWDLQISGSWVPSTFYPTVQNLGSNTLPLMIQIALAVYSSSASSLSSEISPSPTKCLMMLRNGPAAKFFVNILAIMLLAETCSTKINLLSFSPHRNINLVTMWQVLVKVLHPFERSIIALIGE